MRIAVATQCSWSWFTASRRERPASARIQGLFRLQSIAMIELNPVRQRIADLSGRLHSLRGFL